MSSSSTTTTTPPKASGTARGVLLLAAGNIYFILAGMAIQFGLPAVLPRAVFGAYTQVNSIASMFNNVLITGTQQAVSRGVAQEPERARAVQHAGIRMHFRIGLGIAIAFVAAAPVVAWVLHDASKTAPLMLAGVIIAGYAFYAVFIGTANGLHLFGRQAGLSVVFATVRAVAMIAMGVLGMGLIGVVGGWVASVGFIMIAAIVWVGLPGALDPSAKLPIGPMVKFFAGVAVYQILFNALMFVDTVLLKRLMAEHYAAHLPAVSDALAATLPWATKATGYHQSVADLADVQVGYYAAVQNLARLSYQVVLAGAFVAFPLVSKSTFANDKEQTRRYVSTTCRYMLIAAAGFAVVMAANPADVLGLVYAPDFVEHGSAALPLLALGNVAFSLIAIAGTILSSAGRERLAAALAAATLGIAVIGNYIAIPLAAETGHQLLVAGGVTAGAMVLGAVLFGTALVKRFGAFVPLLTVVRVAVAVAVALGVGRVLPLHGKLMTLVEAGVVFAAFVVALFATRELTLGEIKALKSKRARAGA